MEAYLTTQKKIDHKFQVDHGLQAHQRYRPPPLHDLWHNDIHNSDEFSQTLFYMVQHASMSAWQQFESSLIKIGKMISNLFELFTDYFMLVRRHERWFGNIDDESQLERVRAGRLYLMGPMRIPIHMLGQRLPSNQRDNSYIEPNWQTFSDCR